MQTLSYFEVHTSIYDHQEGLFL